MSRTFQPPSADLELGSQIIHRYALQRRLRAAMQMMKRPGLSRLLRSHLDRPIKASEIAHRDNLDELLAGLSVLYIAGLGGADALAALDLDPDDISDLLGDDDVRRYYEAYYPTALPVLLRANFSTEFFYEGVLYAERERAEWPAIFRRFMLLDAVFNANGSLDLFLALLDDYRVRGMGFNDLRIALADEHAMRRWISRPYRRSVLEGMEDFLLFSEDLNAFLESLDEFPILRGAIWLHYSYWYGTGGERMQDMVEWLLKALEHVTAFDMLKTLDHAAVFDEEVSDLSQRQNLRRAIECLTDPLKYPNKILSLVEPELQRWLLHSGILNAKRITQSAAEMRWREIDEVDLLRPAERIDWRDTEGEAG